MQSSLPIDAIAADIRKSLMRAPGLILSATPGSGKTTRVPLICEDLVEGKIIMLEPRRVAARFAAQRLAFERGVRLGDEVGYQIRFDNKTTSKTKIKVVTEGVFTREFLSNPTLEGIGLVILDEFHERSLYTDIALALTSELMQSGLSPVKLIVMSATLESESLKSFSPGFEFLELKGERHELRRVYEPPQNKRFEEKRLEEKVDEQLRRFLSQSSTKNVLVFLPGKSEIERCMRLSEKTILHHHAQACVLHGSLSQEEQSRVLNDQPGRRVIFSTNLAETSLTVPGVNVVIDSGWERKIIRDPVYGIESLELQRISLFSARQREGRAARLGPGLCSKLWTESDEENFDIEPKAEIRNKDLTMTLLTLISIGVSKPENFNWFEAPPGESLVQSLRLLIALNAIQKQDEEDSYRITSLGRRMLAFPLEARQAHLMALAIPSTFLSEACEFCAFSETFFDAKVAQHLESLARRQSLEAPLDKNVNSFDEALLKSFKDRLCTLRQEHSNKALMAGGRGVVLNSKTAAEASKYFLAIELFQEGSARHKEATVSRLYNVDLALIERVLASEIKSEKQVEWDAGNKKIKGRTYKAFQKLPLGVAQNFSPTPGELSQLLAEKIFESWESYLSERPEAQALMQRWRFVKHWLPDVDLPPLNDQNYLGPAFEMLLQGKSSLDQLSSEDVHSLLKGLFTFDQWQLLEREAPAALKLVSGKIVKVNYENIHRPMLRARIQDFFGCQELPRLANAKVALLCDLLAPNFRSTQLTSDLKSFWKNTYAEVRKELKARYPKHKWPEDPHT